MYRIRQSRFRPQYKEVSLEDKLQDVLAIFHDELRPRETDLEVVFKNELL